jgi:hypothetical protein
MKQLRKGSGLVLGLLWLMIADVATAGEYVLVLGKGIEVCEAYLKNLNSFPDDPPMVCEQKVNPKFPELSKPVWQPLDVQEHFDLLEQIEQQRSQHYESEEDFIRDRGKRVAGFNERIAKRELRLATTELEIEQNGTITKEAVLRYEIYDCDPTNEMQFSGSTGRTLYVLNAERTQLDIEKSKNVSYLGRADIFLFKNRVYLTQWGGNMGFKNGTLAVYPPLGTVNYPGSRCDYRYKDKARSNRR